MAVKYICDRCKKEGDEVSFNNMEIVKNLIPVIRISLCGKCVRKAIALFDKFTKEVTD